MAPSSIAIIALWLSSLALVSAQAAEIQCTNWNSTATLTASQIATAGISNATASNVDIALQFEQSNYAHGPASGDAFYEVLANSSNASAGSLLKLEVNTDSQLYVNPPNTALSRIIYQTKNLNGTLQPASAFIMWPYMPKKVHDGYPIVAWGHGNSGSFGECAPSNIRYLLYKYAAPYELALQGYVVIAPDYLGHGVSHDANGKLIRAQALTNPAHANDLFYAVEAAQKAFSSLSKSFVIMGHSEGGGAAYAAAERQAVEPVSGYLGAISGSPVTNPLATVLLYDHLADDSAITTAYSLLDIFPTFQVSQWLTTAGEKIYDLLVSIQGCNAVSSELVVGTGLVYANWTANYYLQSYNNFIKSGGKKISGPLLVLQGLADPAVPAIITEASINATCTAFPNSKLEFATFANVTHVPVMYASQQIWLQWIADRFNGVSVKDGCTTQNYESALPYEYYAPDSNWYIQHANQAYETA